MEDITYEEPLTAVTPNVYDHATEDIKDVVESSPHPCPLLSLPPELRNRIWTLVICERRYWRQTRIYSPNEQPQIRDVTPYNQPPITRTCRELRPETLDLFYGTIVLLIDPHAVSDESKGIRRDYATPSMLALQMSPHLERIKTFHLIPNHASRNGELCTYRFWVTESGIKFDVWNVLGGEFYPELDSGHWIERKRRQVRKYLEDDSGPAGERNVMTPMKLSAIYGMLYHMSHR